MYNGENDFTNRRWQNQSYGYSNPYNTPATNVEYVTSLEEALMRTNSYPSDRVFFHQDRPVFYRVKVDNYGKKSWAEFEYGNPNNAVAVPATQADLKILSDRIGVLEDKLRQEASTNEKSDG